MNNEVEKWYGCYSKTWKGIVSDDSFAHPAKFNRALVERIYSFMIENNWIKQGDSIIDPFGGVALGGFDAMRLGMKWTGVELEERWYTIGCENIEWWEMNYPWFKGTAQLLNGDSRNLFDIIREQSNAIISSPPYAETDLVSGGWNKDKAKTNTDPRLGGYGKGNGQLGVLKSGDIDFIITSPPFENQVPFADKTFELSDGRKNPAPKARDGYGTSDGNLAQVTGETFWQAASQIVDQCKHAIKPGAYTAWIVKAYVKDGKIVDFPFDWRRLMQFHGFTLEKEIHAMQVDESHVGVDLFSGESINSKKDHRSFFRRLNESKGSPVIDHEVVLFMRSQT